MIKRDFKRITNELAVHEKKIDNGHENLAEMKTDIALLLQSVTRIEKLVERNNKGD